MEHDLLVGEPEESVLMPEPRRSGLAVKAGYRKYWSRPLWVLVRTFLLAALTFALLYPLVFLVSGSLMSRADILDPTVNLIPANPEVIRNFGAAVVSMNIPGSLINSLMLCLAAAVAQVLSSTLVGYGFARFRFRFREIIFALVLFTLIVPPQTIIIPLFAQMRSFDVFGIVAAINRLRGAEATGLRLLDSFWPFVLTGLTGVGLKGGLFIYMFRQYFSGIPEELEDAAYVDGAGPLATFFRVVLPNAVPMVTAVLLFSFVWHWTEIYLSSAFIQNRDAFTLALRVALLPRDKTAGFGQFGLGNESGQAVASASLTLMLAPVIVVYLLAQRYFIEGVERSGIVG